MASNEGRSSFLLGITLNELSFIMFFLLMLISAATLQKTNKELEKEIQKKANLQAQLIKARLDHDEAFKRLQLLESRLMRAGGFSSSPSEQQLEQIFARMREVKSQDDLVQTIASLQRQLKSLQRYQQIGKAIERSGLKHSSPQEIEQLILQAKKSTQEQQLLKGRLAYMQKKLKNNGLDHPPCWANPQNGAVEYLYTITLYEQQMRIEAAWPEHRKADLVLIPGAEKLAGKNLVQQQLEQLVRPVFAWSKAHGCRHFVRIKDDKLTSKEAFKQQMLTIEAYFYKYLVR